MERYARKPVSVTRGRCDCRSWSRSRSSKVETRRVGDAQLCVHVEKLTGIVNSSWQIAQRTDSSSLRCSGSGQASGSSSSMSRASTPNISPVVRASITPFRRFPDWRRRAREGVELPVFQHKAEILGSDRGSVGT